MRLSRINNSVLAGVVLLCTYLFSTEIWAQSADYYSATVPVSSQKAADRAEAAAEGLKQVLIRISGLEDVDKNPVIEQKLQQADKYLDQFQYQPFALPNGDMSEALVMSFSPLVVERMLIKEASMPFWPINRPKTLIWLVEDHPELGKQLSNERDNPMLTALTDAARYRGLPLILPLLDLEDQLSITAEQVWDLDETALLMASERYQVDTMLVGRYIKTSRGYWWATWMYIHRGQRQLFDVRSEDIVAVANGGVQPLSDHMASLYSIHPGQVQGSEVYLQLQGISDFGSYRALWSYFEDLAVVSQFQISTIKNGEVLLRMQLNGDLSQFHNAVALAPKIQSLQSEESLGASPWLLSYQGSKEQPLRYRWVAGR